MRLNRFLAAAGVASRRGADELIAAGRVTVNGQSCMDFHFQPAANDHVKVDNKLVRQRPNIYLALHKPAGVVCTRRDPQRADTVYDLLPRKFSSLFYVGRLDAKSEGLLLLTNDGEMAQRLTHPRFKIEKEYEVALDKPVAPELGGHLLRGVTLGGKHARATKVRQISPTRLRIVLNQGINRQIRRMLQHFGFEVKRLVRLRVGDLKLGDLPRGRWRQISAAEINHLLKRI